MRKLISYILKFLASTNHMGADVKPKNKLKPCYCEDCNGNIPAVIGAYTLHGGFCSEEHTEELRLFWAKWGTTSCPEKTEEYRLLLQQERERNPFQREAHFEPN